MVVDAAQQKREEEEKEHNQQAHVSTSLTLLSLLVSILTDQIRNNQNSLNIQIAMDNSIRDCILVFWEKETLLSQVPSLITYGKALVVVRVKLMILYYLEILMFIMCLSEWWECKERVFTSSCTQIIKWHLVRYSSSFHLIMNFYL